MFQDEDIYTFFEPELPVGGATTSRAKISKPTNRTGSKISARKSSFQPFVNRAPHSFATSEKKTNCNGNGHWWSMMRDKLTVHEGSSVLDLKGENYFSCAVGRKRSSARYLLGSSADVVSLLKQLADSSSQSQRSALPSIAVKGSLRASKSMLVLMTILGDSVQVLQLISLSYEIITLVGQLVIGLAAFHLRYLEERSKPESYS